MQFTVRPLTAELEADYERLSGASPSPASQTLAWRDVLAEAGSGEPAYWIAYDERGEAAAGLPAFVRRADRGAVLNSLPFFQSKGGVLCRADLDSAAAAAATTALCDAALAWCRERAVDALSVVISPFDDRGVPGYPSPDFRLERPVSVIDLTKPDAFGHSVREALRKAQRSPLVMREATTEGEARAVYDLYVANMRRMGATAGSWEVYGAIYRRLATRGLAAFAWAELEGEPVSSLVLLRHGGIVDYFAVGSSERGRAVQANSWLCWRQLEAARERGDRWWNWMPSPTPQVHDFKRRWGGADTVQPVIGWVVGEARLLRQSSPEELAVRFPGYFVLPYEQLVPSA